MRLESNSRRNMVGIAALVRHVRRCAIVGKLVSNLEIPQVRKP